MLLRVPFSIIVWLLIFAARSIMSGFYDVWGERPLGFDTFVGYFGKKKTFKILHFLLSSGILLSIIAAFLLVENSFLYLTAINIYMLLFLTLYRFRFLPSGSLYHFLFDSGMVLLCLYIISI